jgi:GTP-binding protein EngB required for normal cell division
MIPPGKYLLFGRTGVGKSSLINTIAQAELASTNTTYICTRYIQPYAFDTPFGSYVLYDSPGFCDDDDPKTDENYFKAILDFLQSSISAESEISILFVLRIDGTRIRSEDFDVVKYLARLLGKFDIPLTLVATWSDFGKGGDFVRSQLDRLRLQRLIMLDAAVLENSSLTKCANGFQGSFAVDNNTGVWLSSCKPISLRIDPLLQSSSAFENLIGHSKGFIFNWIKASGRDPEQLANFGITHLIDNRIYNLTGYPLADQSDHFDFVALSLLSEVTEADEYFVKSKEEFDHRYGITSHEEYWPFWRDGVDFVCEEDIEFVPIDDIDIPF